MLYLFVAYAPDPDLVDLPPQEVPADYPRRRCGEGSGFFRRFFGGDRGGFGRRVPEDGEVDPSRYYNRRFGTRRGNAFGGPKYDVSDRSDVEFV